MGTQSQGTALITGASTGIGAVCADRLARHGYDVILTARNEERLAIVAERIRRSSGRVVATIAADLGRPADIARVEARLRDDQSITLLVNNAGVGSVAPLLEADVGKMDEMIALNIGGPSHG